MNHLSDNALEQLYALAKQKSTDDLDCQVIELLAPYLREKPENGHAWLLYGDALRMLGRFAESSQALKKALELSPAKSRSKVACALGMLYQKFRSAQEAAQWFALATSEEVVDGGWVLRGDNHLLMQEYAEAIRCFSKAATLDSEDYEEAILNLALAHRATGDYGKAARYAQEVLNDNPESEAALLLVKDITPILEKRIGAALPRLH